MINKMVKRSYMFLFSILLIHLFILISLQFTAWPEMVSFPYLINRGFVAYRDMVHAYPPLLINVLAVLYNVFGYNLLVLKIFGWSLILIGDILIFFIVEKLTKKRSLAFLALFGYVLLQPILEGNMVWPDLAIVPFLLLTFILLLKKRYVFAGVAIGLACLTKQTGGLYLVFTILYIVFRERNLRSLVKFLAAPVVMFLILLFSLLTNGAWVEFLNWTIIYPSKYWTKFPGYVQMIPTKRELIILLVLFSPLIILIIREFKKFFKDSVFLLLFGFFVIGVVGVYPRFSFFHFQPALAFLVVLYFYLIRNLNRKFRYFLLIIFALIVVFSLKSLHFGGNRFWDRSDLNFAEVIRHGTRADRPIFLLGLSSSLYTFSNRLPAKPWLDNFGWYFEIPGVQESTIAGWQEDLPEEIFWQTPQSGNWYDIGTYQPKKITDWIVKNYNREKEVEPGVWFWKKK